MVLEIEPAAHAQNVTLALDSGHGFPEVKVSKLSTGSARPERDSFKVMWKTADSFTTVINAVINQIQTLNYLLWAL